MKTVENKHMCVCILYTPFVFYKNIIFQRRRETYKWVKTSHEFTFCHYPCSVTDVFDILLFYFSSIALPHYIRVD